MKKIITVIACRILVLGFSNEACASTTNQAVCPGDGYIFHGQLYSQAGTYINGSDTLVLTIRPTPELTISQTGSLCSSSVTLDAIITNGVPASVGILWAYNGNYINVGESITVTAPGIYVTVAMGVNCGDTSAIYVPACGSAQSICEGGSYTWNGQTYTQAGTYINGSDTLILTVNPAPSISIVESGSLCNGHDSLYVISNNSISSQIVWLYNGSHNGDGTGFQRPITAPGTYTAIAFTASNCTDIERITIPPCYTTYQSICQDDSVFFGNQWLTQAGIYTYSQDTLVLTINPCAPLGYVWPGDANYDGIVNNYDLLPIGIANGLSGPARATTSIVWQGYACIDWGLQLLNGTNIKHADCDGNGHIDNNDTLAIVQNFSLTHNKTDDERKPSREGIPELQIVFLNDRFEAGDMLVASVRLGSAELPVANIYGLAFTYNFDQNVVDASTVNFTYTDSWLGGNTDKVSLAKEFNDIGKVKTAITRIDHINRSGGGEIAQFRAIVTADNINEDMLTTHFISSLKAIDKDENIVELNEGTASAEIINDVSGIAQAEKEILWWLYPNPAQNNITINGTENIGEIVIWNVLGERVYAEAGISKQSQTVEISNLPNGIYIAQILTDKGRGEKRFVVTK